MTDVEVEPAVAAEIFGTRIDLARQFTQALADHGEERGLIGPLEPPRLWSRHILNSAVTAPLFSGRVGDVGSGAGLPGLVLAIARPDVEWILIEPMERRVAWLSEQVAELGLDNVEILRARAEDWRRGPVLDAATARAVSALRTLVPLTAPLVRDGGELIRESADKLQCAFFDTEYATDGQDHFEYLGDAPLIECENVDPASDQLSRDVRLQIGERKHEIGLKLHYLVEFCVDESRDFRLIASRLGGTNGVTRDADDAILLSK